MAENSSTCNDILVALEKYVMLLGDDLTIFLFKIKVIKFILQVSRENLFMGFFNIECGVTLHLLTYLFILSIQSCRFRRLKLFERLRFTKIKYKDVRLYYFLKFSDFTKTFPQEFSRGLVELSHIFANGGLI